MGWSLGIRDSTPCALPSAPICSQSLCASCRRLETWHHETPLLKMFQWLCSAFGTKFSGKLHGHTRVCVRPPSRPFSLPYVLRYHLRLQKNNSFMQPSPCAPQPTSLLRASPGLGVIPARPRLSYSPKTILNTLKGPGAIQPTRYIYCSIRR